jgi:D-sedoheptulose 7-phosphate isomerase
MTSLLSISDYLHRASTLLAESAKAGLDTPVEAAITHLTAALTERLPVLVAGNGGSAADAQHIAGELVSRFLINRQGLPVIALGTNTSTLTAWSNDMEYVSALAREVEAYGRPGGVILGISTSGNSANVIKAFEKAKDIGMHTIALTGAGGGKMKDLADVLVAVPSKVTPFIQEVHVCLYHYICEHVEARCAATA